MNNDAATTEHRDNAHGPGLIDRIFGAMRPRRLRSGIPIAVELGSLDVRTPGTARCECAILKWPHLER